MIQQLINQNREKPSIEEVEKLLTEIHNEPKLLKKAKELASNIGSKA